MTSVYVTLAVAMTMMVVASFWAIYFGPLLRGDADRPWLFHLHGAVFLGWMGLLVAQATLVSIGRTRLHRRVGTLGMAYGALVVALGLAITFVAASMHMASGAWDVDSAAAFLLLPLGDMALFAGFFGAAVAYRRRPELHKRLMLLATVSLLFAAVTRIVPVEPAWIFLLVWLAPLGVAMLHDWRTRGRVHPAYAIGLVILLVAFARVWAMNHEPWLTIGRALLTRG